MSKAAKKNLSDISSILERYPANRSSLIPLLQDVQERFGYISQKAVRELAGHTGISANEVYGVATFYTQFRFVPPGEHTIQVCQGTACHVRGGHQVLMQFERSLGARAGETTPDGRFNLERVACLGCCALAPVVTVDGRVYAAVTVKKIPLIISQYGGGRVKAEAGGDD